MSDHNHENCTCVHEFKYCLVCDVVYCVRCKREWNSYSRYWYTPWSITYSNDAVVTTQTVHTHE